MINSEYIATEEKKFEEKQLIDRIVTEIAKIQGEKQKRYKETLEIYSKEMPKPPSVEELKAEARRVDEQRQKDANAEKQRELEEKQKEQAAAKSKELSVITIEVFVQKYCPNYIPDNDMFQSIETNPGDPKIVEPDKISREDRDATQSMVENFLIAKGQSGFRPGSPKDIEFKCEMFGSLLVSTLHLYKIENQ